MLNFSAVVTGSGGGGSPVFCERISEGTVRCNDTEYHLEGERYLTYREGSFWLYLCLYMTFVLFAGLMSGLTMGLLSLDKMSLEVLKRGGKDREKKYARRILIIVKRHHLLLVTLLLANAVAVEAMPVFLSKITNEVVAIVVSVTAVLVFGEIVPQALCTRFGLAIGYYCSPIVLVLMVLLVPITFPISLLLDLILGKGHGTFFRRAELKELVKMHGAHNHDDPLSYDEVLILKSALDMRYKTVKDAMTPVESVFMLNITSCIDGTTMKKLLAEGHSRVPVYEDDHSNVCGLLLVKKLIQLDPDDGTPIRTIQGAFNAPPSCLTTTPLYEQLNQFQTGRSHLSLVYEEGEHDTDLTLVGIITLEDVIEELIGEEIVDETDQYVDVHRRIAVARATLASMKHSASEPAPGKYRRDRMTEKEMKRPTMMSLRSHSLPDGTSSTLTTPASTRPTTRQHSKEIPLEDVSNGDRHQVTSGGLDLETIYKLASPVIREESMEDTAQDADSGEEAPLIT